MATQFKLIAPNTKPPVRATVNSAGFDLYTVEDVTIVGGAGNVVIKTGIAAQFAPGYYGRIAIRSSLARDQHLNVSAGVIDRDYRGEIMVLVFCSKNNYRVTLEAGIRFAQIIPEKISDEPAIIVTEFSENYDDHVGFGSTGSK